MFPHYGMTTLTTIVARLQTCTVLNTVGTVVILYYIVIISGTAVQRGLWPPRSRGSFITHSDAPQSVGTPLDE
jgi:hypothetical protein